MKNQYKKNIEYPVSEQFRSPAGIEVVWPVALTTDGIRVSIMSIEKTMSPRSQVLALHLSHNLNP